MSFDGITAILFDLDGTLTDYNTGCESGLREALKIFNKDREKQLSWDIFFEAYNGVIEAESAWSSRHGIRIAARDNRMKRFRLLFEALGISPGTVIPDMADAYGFGRSNGTRLFPEVHEILKYLKQKYKLGLLTEGAAQTQRDQIIGQKIGSYFQAIVISGETPWHKPDESLFRFACVKLETDPEKILMVGDRLDWDIKPAREIGMKTILLDRDAKINESDVQSGGADLLIHHLNELRSIL